MNGNMNFSNDGQKSYGLGIGAKEKTAAIKRTDGGDFAYEDLKKVEGHPLNIFYKENEAIKIQISELKGAITKGENIERELEKFRDIAIHFAEKGDLLYPPLKGKYGFAGPSDVMWTVDDEIRDDLKALSNELKSDASKVKDEEWLSKLNDAIERSEQMLYKEENILYPLCAKNFSKEDWQDIARDIDDYKPCMIDKMPLWENATRKTKVTEMPGSEDEITLPSGHMTLHQLDAMLNTIPVEITFIDENNINRYFNDGDEMKLFKRPLMALDREVFSCHPPKIEPMVRMLIEDFKQGKRDMVEIWNTRDDEPVLIRYMAVRDKDKNYVGTVECVMKMGFAKEHFSKGK